MSSLPKVLLLDDGKLSKFRQTLLGLGVELDQPSGSGVQKKGSYDLVVATTEHIMALGGSSGLSVIGGNPIWIAVHDRGSLPIRIKLRKLGVRFLVQTGVSSEPLRLLLSHILHQGPKRRDTPRLPIGAQVICRDGQGSPFHADLLDLTREGCRLATHHPLRSRTVLALSFPKELVGGRDVEFNSVIVRVDLQEGSTQRYVAVKFEDLGPAAIRLLDAVIMGDVVGTAVSRLGNPRPGDDAAVATVAAAPEESKSASPSQANRRLRKRVDHSRDVAALHDGSEYVILGRDLSIHGMRSEHLGGLRVGSTLELAIYGKEADKPVVVRATVDRDDGVDGTVFRFEKISTAERQRLEAIIDSGKEIQSLEHGRSGESLTISRARVR